MKHYATKIDGSILLDDLQDTDCFSLDASNIQTEDGITRLQQNVIDHVHQLAGLSFMGSLLPQYIMTGVTCYYLHPKFQCLEEINFSYISLSADSISHICGAVNAFTGLKTIKKLILSNCSLGPDNTIMLLKSLCGNTTIEDLIISGNKCTDLVIPHIVTLLDKFENYISTIGLAGNAISGAGTGR
jgi:hypothetical protein